MTMPPAPAAADATVRTRSLVFLMLAQVAAMSTWFATTASLTAIRQGWTLTPFHEGLLTSGVQAGFVAGTLTSALLSAADRYDLRRLFASSAALAAHREPADRVVRADRCRHSAAALRDRLLPRRRLSVGMKIASTWAKGDLGLLIGLLVGAVTLGSAAPHLFAHRRARLAPSRHRGRRLRDPRRDPDPLGRSRTRTAGRRRRFRLANAFDAFRSPSVRLANFGYFGHMWELYAMWAWIGSFLAASFALRYGDAPPISAGVVTFLIVASGALGCLRRRLGRRPHRPHRRHHRLLIVSGACALVMGFAFGGPAWIIVAIGIVWGVTIVSDSAQFSASVTELSDRSLVGTMLTVQTCIGFLLTLLTIHLMPYAVALLGWTYAFTILAIGPAFGIWAMARLRARPESVRLAGGRR